MICNQDGERISGKMREPALNPRETFPDICVCCGAPVPEGTMVCWKCENEKNVEEICIKKKLKDG